MEWRRFVTYLSNDPRIIHVTVLIAARNGYYIMYMYICWCCNVSIKGGELFEFIETEGRVDEDVTVRLMRQVLEGVQFLHGHNILHMDIKVGQYIYVSVIPVNENENGNIR